MWGKPYPHCFCEYYLVAYNRALEGGCYDVEFEALLLLKNVIL